MIDEDIFDDLNPCQVYDITDVWNDGIRIVECTVDVPEDMFPGITSEDVLIKERFLYAAFVADGEDGLPDYVSPCNWYLVWNHDNEVRVARESRI